MVFAREEFSLYEGSVRKREKITKIQEVLDELYPQPAIPLNHRDPYTLLVATVLSAQCTDVRVNQVTAVLFAEAQTPDDMVALGRESIEEIIRPCGLAPAKSRNIWSLSGILLEGHAGEVPESFEELEALPGVGHKTASVVMSQAFGVPAFPVDTHIHRLATRWGLTDGSSVVQTEKDLKRLYPEDRWNSLHLQIIYFGREYCKARGHVVEDCPICRFAARNLRAGRNS